jgi:probable phosphoglycerate mutase
MIMLRKRAATSTIAVIRPGQTDFDRDGRIQGTLDLPLNPQGGVELGETIESVQPLELERIFASPTEPAATTAREIGRVLGIPVKELSDLANVDHGLWQGLCLEEIRRKQPRLFRQWEESPESVCPPAGESCQQAYVRAENALRTLLRGNRRVAVVCSDPMATIVTALVQGDPPRMPLPGRGGESPRVTVLESHPATSRSRETNGSVDVGRRGAAENLSERA